MDIELRDDMIAFNWGDDWEWMFAYDLKSWQIGFKVTGHVGYRCVSLYLLCFESHLSKWLSGWHEYVDCPNGVGCGQCIK